jgi:hypothetical protein
LTAEFVERFGEDPLEVERWEFQGDRDRTRVQSTAAGLELSIPADSKQRVFIGPVPLLSLEGDFEIIADFMIPESMPREPGLDRPPSFNLFLAAAKTSPNGRSSASLGWTISRDGPAFEANLWLPRHPSSVTAHHQVLALPSLACGRLRLQRTGSQLQFCVAEDDASDFRPVHRAEFVGDPIDKIHLAVHGGAGTPSAVVWKRFQVRAGRALVRDPAKP